MGVAPCRFGRLHRDGRRVLCFADWSKEYGVPAWFTKNGYVKDVTFCRLYCEKRPDMVTVELEAKEKPGGGTPGQREENMTNNMSICCNSSMPVGNNVVKGKGA